MSENEWSAFSSALEGKGWLWTERVLFAPNKTMWLSSPWPRDMLDMCARMQSRLERIRKSKQWVTEKEFERIEADTLSLVEELVTLTAQE